MSDESTPGQAVALAEIRTLEKATPPGTALYTPEVDQRRQALYQRAYPDEPEEGEPKGGRDFPEQHKARKDVGRRRAVVDAGDDDTSRRSRARDYVEDWGSYQPSGHDIAQWDRAVAVSAKVGISPEQLAALRDAMLENAPDADADEGGAYRPDDYRPPVTIEDDASWAIYKEAAKIAAKHNIPPAAFKELSHLVLAGNEIIGEPQMARAQKAAIGELLDANNASVGAVVVMIKQAQRAIEHFAPYDRQALDRLLATPVAGGLTVGDHPAMIGLLGNVGAAVAYDAIPREFKSPTGHYQPPASRQMGNSEAIKAQIKRLEAEAPLGQRTREQDREIQALYEAAYPANADDDDASRSSLGSVWGR